MVAMGWWGGARMALDTQVVRTAGLVGMALVVWWLFRSKRPSAHFSLEELTTTNTGLPNVPTSSARANLDKLANQVLEPLRERFGPILITSGYRSPAVNAAVGGTVNPPSDHLTGTAADLYAQDGTPATTMAAWLYDSSLNLDQVIVEFHTGHLHIAIDTGAAPYRRSFLQTFDGKTYEAWSPGGRIS